MAGEDRPDYRDVVERLGLFRHLAAFDPHCVGTPPLGVAMPGSDIDIVCCAPDPEIFARSLWNSFGHHEKFGLRQWIGDDRPVIASFAADGWEIEIFGQDLPVVQQQGWRHFDVERRLLALGGEAFRQAILDARREGRKTEPAFAAVLRLDGDPYKALLDVQARPDSVLLSLLADADFRRPKS